LRGTQFSGARGAWPGKVYGIVTGAIVQHGVLKPGIVFLHKPFTSDTLGRKIREVLRNDTPTP
jgi:hypothetical protein